MLNRYNFNPTLKRALNKFVRGGRYDLTMDDGCQVKTLTLTLPLEKGTTLVMNVVVVLEMDEREEVCCPMCGEIIPMSPEERAAW